MKEGLETAVAINLQRVGEVLRVLHSGRPPPLTKGPQVDPRTGEATPKLGPRETGIPTHYGAASSPACSVAVSFGLALAGPELTAAE